MKKIASIVLIALLSIPSIAQESKKQSEVGIICYGFDNLGLTFKTGTDKSLFRFNAMIFWQNSDQNTEDYEMNENQTGYHFSVGKEFRKKFDEKFAFRYGADVLFVYSKSEFLFNNLSNDIYDNESERISYQPGINLVCGLNYSISEKFIVGFELLPSFSYIQTTSVSKYINKEVTGDGSGFSFGLSNSSVLVSFSYIF